MVKGFVPTMGALHEGHASLIRAARKECDEVVVSVFVNPLQFNDKSDLDKYPRTPKEDEAIAVEAGATKVWFPTYEEIYPGNIELIQPGPVGDLYEGAFRPGHFAGMLTVVRRLFDLVKPDKAFFGEKDFQQLIFIKEMAEKRNPPVGILAVPTQRDSDEVALSSRNIYLSSDQRNVAKLIPDSLKQAVLLANRGKSKEEIINYVKTCIKESDLIELDYVEILSNDLREIKLNEIGRILIAAKLGETRLIDNMPIMLRQK